MLIVYRVIAASPPLVHVIVRRFAVAGVAPMASVKLGNGVAAPSVTVIAASDVGSIAAGARSVSGLTRDCPGSRSPCARNPIGSTWKWNALGSPGMQPGGMSPLGGAHTWLPSLSTTLGADTTVHSAPVGSGGPGIRTTAGPSASNPPCAGTCWSPEGFQ